MPHIGFLGAFWQGASAMKDEWEWKRRADMAIAHGALTNSKRPQSFIGGVYPSHLARGQGAHVWDTNGRKYIDFVCGLGTNLLGYANAEVTEAVIRQARNGATLSLGTPLEVQLAEKIKEFLPWVDRVRFLKTGSEACTAAVRIARAATGRPHILSDGYHGWNDQFVSLTPPSIGVNSDMNISNLARVVPDTNFLCAGVIVEPVITDWHSGRRQWLEDIRTRCSQTATTLIYDEIITGFRFPKHSVSEHTGVRPDLICLGKAIANGMPLSVVAGRKEVMECGEYFVSSTFAGETLSLAAGLETLRLLQTKYSVDYLWNRGDRFMNEFNSIWPEGVRLEGYPTRGILAGPEKALFMQEACKAGQLWGSSWFFNFSHIELADQVLSACTDIIRKIKHGGVTLEGDPPVSPFAQKVRGG